MSILNSFVPAQAAPRQTWLRSARDWLSAALRRRRGKLELAQLDDHLLQDIGLTRYDIGVPRRKPHFEHR